MYRCEKCNHLYNHQLETSKGGTYSHGCGEWIEIWPSKFAKCALTALHDEPCLGEVVTNHIPRKDYAAYVNANAGA